MTYLPDSNVRWIVVHYSATPIESDIDSATIDRWHRERGFREIGYHIYIRKDGSVEYGRDLSQPGRFEQGAHSRDENSQSVGVCYEGGVTRANPNYGFDTRTAAQKNTMIREIEKLKERFPNAIVMGHRDMPGASTQCPGFNASLWWSEVEARKGPFKYPRPVARPAWITRLFGG